MKSVHRRHRVLILGAGFLALIIVGERVELSRLRWLTETGEALFMLPALLKVTVEYTALFYVALFLLEGSLALRVAGDLLSWFTIRQWGGMLNVPTMLVFMFIIAGAVITARSQASRR